jgi:uncharacterized protein (DUF885 family)
MDRRQFLMSSASAATTAAVAADPAMAASSPSAAMKALCDKTYAAYLKASPILCTILGVDKGLHAGLKSRIEGDTAADRAAYGQMLQTALKGLGGIDRARLTGMDRINFDTLKWQWSAALSGVKDFTYGIKAPSQTQAPYVITHLTGMAQALPDFFDTNHLIDTRDDAEAYVARLERYGAVLNSETGHFHEDVAAGARPPVFILQRAIAGLKGWRGQVADDNSLITSLTRRTKEKGIGGDWTARAKAIVEAQINPALDGQIAALEAQLPKATDEAGVWKLPQGDAYYAHMVHCGTTTRQTPDEVHKIGLEKVAELSALADQLLRAQGLTQGTVSERMAALYTDPRFIAPDTDAGREQVLASARALIDKVSARLPAYFSTLPRAKLIVRRPPPVLEGAGAPYYFAGTLDGSRPGSYYLQLAHTSGTPSWTLPSTTFHEGLPGHHLQNSLLMENDAIPLVRKLNLAKPISDFNAYDEGWALYSEQLADEMGLYADDPFGRIGYVNDALFRAGRLVVDTGLHHLRWSRDKAVDYMTGLTGKRPEAQTEINRYCVWPGQALGYMMGKIQWLKLRAAMQAKQGSAFDIKRFHATGLEAGSTGFDVLEGVYREKGLI